MAGLGAQTAEVDAPDLSRVSDLVRQAVEALLPVLASDPVDQPGAAALEDMRVLLAVKERFDAHLLVRLRDIDQRGLHELDALPTIGTWVDAQTSSVDRPMVALARRLDRLPTVARELRSGRLSMAAAQRVAIDVARVRSSLDQPHGLIDGQPGDEVLDGVIGRGVPMLFAEALGGLDDDDPRMLDLLQEVTAVLRSGRSQAEQVEAAFVALAERIEGRLLRGSLDQLIDALLPMQLEERARAAHENRGVALLRNHSGSGGRLEADLDDEGFELLHTALAARLTADPENVADTAAAALLREQGIDPYGDDRGPLAPRTLLQRRHDALVAILRDWLGSGVAGRRGKAVPHISVRVGLDLLHGRPGALPARGGSGRVLPAGLVRQWWCDSAVTRFVMGLGGRVIEMSHTERTLKAHERKAKQMETGGQCLAAGCHPPPGTRLIPHHPQAYARSGITTYDDTVPLCESSHHLLHLGKVLRLKDGRLLGPDGWIRQIGPT